MDPFDDDVCPICGSDRGCRCCQRCGAETFEDCECCDRCHGSGETTLLAGLEWNYVGSGYGPCPNCGGTGMR